MVATAATSDIDIAGGVAQALERRGPAALLSWLVFTLTTSSFEEAPPLRSFTPQWDRGAFAEPKPGWRYDTRSRFDSCESLQSRHPGRMADDAATASSLGEGGGRSVRLNVSWSMLTDPDSAAVTFPAPTSVAVFSRSKSVG